MNISKCPKCSQELPADIPEEVKRKTDNICAMTVCPECTEMLILNHTTNDWDKITAKIAIELFDEAPGMLLKLKFKQWQLQEEKRQQEQDNVSAKLNRSKAETYN